MMKKLWKRVTAALLCVMMTAMVLPTAAFASLLGNDSATNAEILAALEEICGSEEEAELYYAMLRQYDLLDEDGNAIEDWEITMNGKSVTLEEIRDLLNAAGTDLSQTVMVDGTPITLENLQTIITIEDYLAYLQETYFNGYQWSSEQLANLQSLVEQINSTGIEVLSSDSGITVTDWPSGVSHNARVTVTDNGDGTFTAVLSGAMEEQAVSFDWAALSGTQTVSGSGTVELTVNSAGVDSETVSFTMETMDADDADNPVRSEADLVYYLKLDNITNALFSNEKTTMSVECTTDATVSEMAGEFDIVGTDDAATYEYEFSEAQKNAIRWGNVDTLTLTESTFLHLHLTCILSI